MMERFQQENHIEMDDTLGPLGTGFVLPQVNCHAENVWYIWAWR